MSALGPRGVRRYRPSQPCRPSVTALSAKTSFGACVWQSHVSGAQPLGFLACRAAIAAVCLGKNGEPSHLP